MNQKIIELFENWAKESIISVEKLPPSGSYREYFRLKSENKTAIATQNFDKKENIAFIELTKHFFAKGFSVPELYATDIDNNIYLQQDLENLSLFDFLTFSRKNSDDFPAEVLEMYQKTIQKLILIQLFGGENLDFSLCYPREAFDKQSIMWDLNYFKYYFLKFSKIPFDEQLLENDFHTFCDFLLKTGQNYFLYRDFQSRNILIFQNEPYFIDYQGGRKGSLFYDLASLLYDSIADIPQKVRNELTEFYIQELQKFISVNKQDFYLYFDGYILIRLLQAMGAFGFRGMYEKKEIFLQSIPFALQTLDNWLKNNQLAIEIPELKRTLWLLVENENLRISKNVLVVSIQSFSYRKGIPEIENEDKGGFVFDCRCLPNPGRDPELSVFTGKHPKIQEFFEKQIEIQEFLNSVYSLVNQAITNYQKRNKLRLSISFGCTGGKHRSVFCAEKTFSYIKKYFSVSANLKHCEIE